MLKNLLLFLSIFLVFRGHTQNPITVDSTNLYSPEELHLDMQQMHLALNTIHSGMDDFESASNFNLYYDSLYSSIKEPLTELQFYKYVLLMVAKIGSGHTSAWPQTSLKLNSLPLHLLIIKNNFYVSRNMSGSDELPDGSKILSINGLSSHEIIQRLTKLVPGDGYITTGRIRLLQKFYFNILYGLFIGEPDSYKIDFIPYGGKKAKSIVIKPLEGHVIEQNYSKKYGSKPYPFAFSEKDPLVISYDYKRSVATLTIKRFFTMNKEPRDLFDTFFLATFKKLKEKNIHNLIIDVRDNGGGDNRKVSLLYSYLTDSSFSLNRRMEVKNLKYSAFSDEPYNYNKYTYEQNSEGIINIVSGAHALKPVEPNPDHFEGSVYILMDGGSYSATSQFLSLLHSNKRAIFIGEECGGIYTHVTGGRIVTVKLNHTGVRLNIPPLKEVYDVGNYAHGHGVQPDYPVINTIEDFLNGKDRQLLFVQNLIDTRK